MKTKGTAVARLRKFRSERRVSLSKRAGVLGTGLGLKTTGGVTTDEPVVVVIVRTKKADSRLADHERVPSTLRIAGRSVRTDVIQIRSFNKQSGHYCWDGASQGIVSAFARSDGTTYGVTCAHCMVGSDQDDLSSVPMAMYNSTRRRYEAVGESSYSIIAAGAGSPSNYGFLDAGMFTLSPEQARRLLPRPRALKQAELKLGMQVRGTTAHAELVGSLDLTEIEFGRVLVDALIRMDGVGTYGGDSGMMWTNDRRDAVGVHAMGSDLRPGAGSEYSAAMFATRVGIYLGVDLLWP